ncbi:hypothetical protein GGP96_002113 [Salinibacter ruber]|uniref:hypothetical protein n=1 Tax=Salinibacter ruber TaxID=146919 RepID=UPI002169A97C|nr:hypothetical protein [Salinibacter ruber]MCS4177388.1 hypothetical protein [Salinibacter ruber]
MKLLFYTAVNKKYEHFIPIYCYFALRSEKKSLVEVGVQNKKRVEKENEAVLRILRNRFGNRIKLTELDFEGILPGAVRFINEPVMSNTCKYVYIGDIDILILDDKIVERHLNNMSDYDVKFSNVIRRESKMNRLSGLHFAPTEVQYPLPNMRGINYNKETSKVGADENVLYKIMKRKGYMVKREMSFRPTHGIHMRYKSPPFGKRRDHESVKMKFKEIKDDDVYCPWDGLEKKVYRKRFLDEMYKDSFREMYFDMDIKARNMINVLENACLNRFGDYAKESYDHILKNTNREKEAARSYTKRFIKKAISYIIH